VRPGALIFLNQIARIVFLIEINLEQFRFTTPLSDVRL
jgi:hypothetical protein